MSNEGTAETYHTTVLLKESVDAMAIVPNGTYVDLTFGGGGHSKEILSRLGSKGRLLAFDQDADAMQNIPKGDARLTCVHSKFRYLQNWLDYYAIEEVDAIIADLGVSGHHFDDASRGFSFRFDAALDMRMNRHARLTAAQVVNTYKEEELAQLFYLYGELKNGRKLAQVIARKRTETPVETVENLLNIIKPLLPPAREKKELAKLFQALRIEVNREMEALEAMLQAAVSILRPGGRLVILTYHSLEDRLVKNLMRSGNTRGEVQTDFFGKRQSPMKPIQTKPIVADAEEQERNPRSRSAKLRFAEKINVEE